MAHPVNQGHWVQRLQNVVLQMVEEPDNAIIKKIQIVAAIAIAFVATAFIASCFKIEGTAITILFYTGWTAIGIGLIAGSVAPIVAYWAIRRATA